MVTKSSSFVVLLLTILGMITIIPPLNAQKNIVENQALAGTLQQQQQQQQQYQQPQYQQQQQQQYQQPLYQQQQYQQPPPTLAQQYPQPYGMSTQDYMYMMQMMQYYMSPLRA